jgi:hypothetical protein
MTPPADKGGDFWSQDWSIMASQDIQPDESISQINVGDVDSFTDTSRAVPSTSQSVFLGRFSAQNSLPVSRLGLSGWLLDITV